MVLSKQFAISLASPSEFVRKDSAPPLRTRRLCGELFFWQNSTAETQSALRLRRESVFRQTQGVDIFI